MKNKVRQFIQGTRPLTLLIAGGSVLIGTALAWRIIYLSPSGKLQILQGLHKKIINGSSSYVNGVAEQISNATPHITPIFMLITCLCFIIAIFWQISSNFVNDYFDGKNSVDKGVEKRANQANLQFTLICGIVFLAMACLAGILLLVVAGNIYYGQVYAGPLGSEQFHLAVDNVWANFTNLRLWQNLILPLFTLGSVGIIAVLAILGYSGGKKPYGYRGFGEVSVFIFFGLFGVLGTCYLLVSTADITATNSFSTLVIITVIASVVHGLTTATVLTVNNLRDLDSDLRAGKRTIIVKLGFVRGRWVLVSEMLILPMVGICGIVLLWYSAFSAFSAALILPSLTVGILLTLLLFRINPQDDNAKKRFALLFKGSIFYSIIFTINFSLVFAWGL